MDLSRTIILYQPLLHSIAYKFVRCKQDAEDIVQETFVKWLSVEQHRIENTKAYLIKAVKNNCINHLQALKRKKEEYFDQVSLAEIIHRFKETNLAHLDLDVNLNAALKVIHDKLEPLERAVYLLKEVFELDYDELQNTLNKKKDHCRQLFSRAKKKLSDGTSKINLQLPASHNLLNSFRKACDLGNATEFVNELKKEIGLSIQKKR
jgi:RNA polymerase sigma-70 factor (ECF subfamily)